jgi:peptide/nickel transport system substrate-binding protein
MRRIRYWAASLLIATSIVLDARLPTIAQEKVLNIGVAVETSSLDPHFFNTSGNYNVNTHIFEFLFKFDDAMRPQPHLAESIKRIDDLTWEIKLRQGIRWHTGEPFTADDVVFNNERAKSGDLRSASPTTRQLLDKTFTAIDAHTVRVRTNTPNPLTIVELTYTPMVSRRHGTGATTESYNSGRAVVGTGPYKLVEWRPGNRLVLERNDDYWGPKPEWNRIIYQPITSGPTRIAALLAGNVDVINDVPVMDVRQLAGKPNVAVTSSPPNRVLYLMIDQHRDVTEFVRAADGSALNHNPLKKEQVRRAISLAINRQAIVDRLLEGQAEPAGQPQVPLSFGYAPDIKADPFDPTQARALLAAAGYPNGLRMTIHGPSGRYVNDVAVLEAIAQMLTRIGIVTTVATDPPSTYFGNAEKYAVALLGYGSDTGEASSGLTSLLATPDRARNRGHVNRGRYSNPTFDALVERAVSTFDDAERDRLMQEATRMAMRDLGLVPLFWQKSLWGHRTGLNVPARLDERTLGYTIRSK